MKRQQDIAFELASKAHKGQFRRDGVTLYIEHPREVARIAGDRWGFDDELIAVAWLHDTQEQTALTSDDLRNAGISTRVIGAVEALTLNKLISYFDNIRCLRNDELARRVKIADNLANLGDEPTDRQILKYAKSLQVLMED